jgi:tRNA pseudouridine55 synthase
LEKEYEAIIRLGYATDTGDRTGKPISLPEAEARGTGPWSRKQIEAALESLRGNIEQVPPMYSAKKQAGKKLYELARRGEEVERKPVPVCIHTFVPIKRTGQLEGELLKNNLDGTFDFEVRVACSAGTYVRTLAEDFGKKLNVGAHLAELRRTRVGDFSISGARTLEEIKIAKAEEALGTILLTLNAALSHLPGVDISAADQTKVRNGVDIQIEGLAFTDGERVRLRDEMGNLVAVAEFDAVDSSLHPNVVIAAE